MTDLHFAATVNMIKFIVTVTLHLHDNDRLLVVPHVSKGQMNWQNTHKSMRLGGCTMPGECPKLGT